MTERKYLIGAEGSTPVDPRYKERKFLKDPVQKLQLSGALNGRKWRFLTAGFDDFRDGYPIPEAGILTQPHHGTEAAIFGLTRKVVKSPKRRFNKEQVCFSKQNCLRQTRRHFVDVVEQSLSAHPLALYPHLGSGMSPELFVDVLSVLDPAMHIRIETPLAKQEECSKEHRVPHEGLIQQTLPEQIRESPDSPISRLHEVQNSTSRNPYKLMEAKEIFAKEDRTISNKSMHSTFLDEEINRVTKLFCDWVSSLGEQANDITETTILNLFTNGCEKKPVLTFKNVEANQKPKEMCKHYSHNVQQKDAEQNKVYAPGKKTTYGAWYLNPNTWKKQLGNEPLRDPSVPDDSELEHQSTEKDEEMKQVYGAQAFKQFIINKGLRVPGFLCSVFSEEEQKNRTKVTAATASACLTCSGTALL